jgi:hypothetical protein
MSHTIFALNVFFFLKRSLQAVTLTLKKKIVQRSRNSRRWVSTVTVTVTVTVTGNLLNTKALSNYCANATVHPGVIAE